MARYFIEVAYKGTNYAGFQVQQNANTIQAEVEKALAIYFRQVIALTGSSRTDAGVHARQNYFHFDAELVLLADKVLYHLNAILPADIVVKNILPQQEDAHCRFDAISRTYIYSIYSNKNPFISETAFYYPYTLNQQMLHQAAALLMQYTNFESFSKKNTQVNNFICSLSQSEWHFADNLITYKVTGNRFLRGMVRGLVGTMLHVGREKYSLAQFKQIIESQSAHHTDFSTPAHGLILEAVKFPFINS
jgi:tRNA pseudouridine38-40 synthase